MEGVIVLPILPISILLTSLSTTFLLGIVTVEDDLEDLLLLRLLVFR